MQRRVNNDARIYSWHAAKTAVQDISHRWDPQLDGGSKEGETRRLITRTCKVFRFARKLNTAPASLESRRRGSGQVWGRVGLGSATVVLCGPAHREPLYINRY